MQVGNNMPKTIPRKWRNQDWNLHPLYKITLPTCHRWVPWLSQEKDNLRTAMRKARIGALLKSPGLVENRDRKGLAWPSTSHAFSHTSGSWPPLCLCSQSRQREPQAAGPAEELKVLRVGHNGGQ